MKRVLLTLIACATGSTLWAQTAFEAKLAEIGINPTQCTKIEDSSIMIDEPDCAYANLTDMEGSNTHAVLDFYDNKGNYIQKNVIVGIQGNSDAIKQSFAIELCEDEWLGEETTDLTIGNWPAQDEFHLKAFYEDGLRGIAEVAYQLYGQISGRENCYPKAFPVMLYRNGDFYGLMAWQLKKHRDNMGLDKKNSTHIWLDGKLTNKNLWQGDIDWTDFEVRNPKDLFTMDGSDYDGDEPAELMDQTSAAFIEGKGKHERCAEAKQHIVELSTYCTLLSQAEAANSSSVYMCSKIKDMFDVEQLINYRIFSLVTNNYDGFGKNWQWFTYDAQQWTVAPYDCQLTFGYNDATDDAGNRTYTLWEAKQGSKKYDYKMENTATDGPMQWITTYYADQLKSRYAELRNQGIISAENITKLLEAWVNRVGESNYATEFAAWADCPFQVGVNESLDRLFTWVNERIALEDSFLGYDDPSAIQHIQHPTDVIKDVYSLTGNHSAAQRGLVIIRYTDGSNRKVYVK